MGGGPVDGETDDVQSLSSESSPTFSGQIDHSSTSNAPAVQVFYPSVPQVSSTTSHVVDGGFTARQDGAESLRDCPVLTTAATGGLVGGLVGSLFGMGSILGTTAGAFAGASIASRDDAMGAKARQQALDLRNHVENGIAKAFDRVNQEPIGRDVTTKLSNALQVLTDAGERYRVGEKVEAAAVKVVQVAEPKIRMVAQKITEADQHGYLGKAADVLQQVDNATGFTRSVDAIKRELRC